MQDFVRQPCVERLGFHDHCWITRCLPAPEPVDRTTTQRTPYVPWRKNAFGQPSLHASPGIWYSFCGRQLCKGHTPQITAHTTATATSNAKLDERMGPSWSATARRKDTTCVLLFGFCNACAFKSICLLGNTKGALSFAEKSWRQASAVAPMLATPGVAYCHRMSGTRPPPPLPPPKPPLAPADSALGFPAGFGTRLAHTGKGPGNEATTNPKSHGRSL